MNFGPGHMQFKCDRVEIPIHPTRGLCFPLLPRCLPSSWHNLLGLPTRSHAPEATLQLLEPGWFGQNQLS